MPMLYKVSCIGFGDSAIPNQFEYKHPLILAFDCVVVECRSVIRSGLKDSTLIHDSKATQGIDILLRQ
jgi:hypothetical protein